MIYAMMKSELDTNSPHSNKATEKNEMKARSGSEGAKISGRLFNQKKRKVQ